MKAVKLIGKSLFLALSFLALSCSSDSDGGGGTPSGYYLTAKVDGANYSNSDLFEPTASEAGSTLMIQSSNNSGDSFSIVINNYHGPDTYNSGNNDITPGYINYLDAGASIGEFTSYTSVRGDGQVIITAEDDTKVEGTFTATVFENEDGSTNDKEVTNGSFRATKE